MDPFVDQLAQLSRAQVTRAKWIFVSSLAIGSTFVERIAQSSTDWVNPRFVTPLERRLSAHFVSQRAGVYGRLWTGATSLLVLSREGGVEP